MSLYSRLLVALLFVFTMAFYSQGPQELSVRRIASCADPSDSSLSSFGAISMPIELGFLGAVAERARIQGEQNFQIFVQQLALNSAMQQMSGNLKAFQPTFRQINYDLPLAQSLDYSRPNSSGQAFRGLAANPDFRHLVTPGASALSVAGGRRALGWGGLPRSNSPAIVITGNSGIMKNPF